MTHKPLEGRVAVVTGAGSGIGRGCAMALAEAGAMVIVTDINATTAGETHLMIEKAGGKSAAFTLDVSADEAWSRVLGAVRRDFGPVRVLVNNAAIKGSAVGDAGLLDTTLPVWDAIMSANLRGPMLGARHVLPDMVAEGSGAIIMMTSTAALRSVPNFATAYTSAKAGMLGLTRCIAVSYGVKGVRCNAIAPGVILVDESPTMEAFRKSSGGLVERPGRPSDIANMVVYRSSDAGQYVNGQTISVDGGLIAHMPSLSNK